MFRAIFAFLLASTVSAHAEYQDWSGGYYCKMLASGGVEYEKTKNEWKGAVFGVSDIALMLSIKATGNMMKSPNGPIPTYLVRVKKFGDQGEAQLCAGSGNNSHVPVFPDGSGSCNSGFDYVFDLSSLKLQVSFHGGFMDDSGTNFDTPFVAIAKCDKAS